MASDKYRFRHCFNMLPLRNFVIRSHWQTQKIQNYLNLAFGGVVFSLFYNKYHFFTHFKFNVDVLVNGNACRTFLKKDIRLGMREERK